MPRLPGLAARIELSQRPGPFTVDVGPDGRPRTLLILTAQGLPPPGSLGGYHELVAWIAPPTMDSVVRLSMLTASDFDPSKQPDVCPVTVVGRNNAVHPRGQVAQATIHALVKHGVSMTSTLAVYEPFVANRPTKEPRVLNAMAPEVRASYMQTRQEIDSSGAGPITIEGLKSAMAFEREFVDAGGNLAAGVDPTGLGGALAGYGDQRNYELFIEAGFAPAMAIRIMSLNGAKILGVDRELGSVERGKRADLVVLEGDLTATPAAIEKPSTVFKDGVAYDSAKLIASVEGRVGID